MVNAVNGKKGFSLKSHLNPRRLGTVVHTRKITGKVKEKQIKK